ncbi:S1 domain-containing RNA-binding protein [Fructilactobacillus carniphilus]|uniref:S1 domain-containing RNA-binding protein n=1 Tax=Fructilactobacillus carniphilus TaxID=2940297 RepID=A0ABY5BVQ3_9LACO|nr:S1 domain-containing RNA-binding protein [Fructilactobacillus carniphilus]USS90137.1 S1 domain-containing RNA-binding protein [Fructilactobacillus carniphilus]
MALEVGEILTGKVTGITGFGAFVDLGNRQTGLVHISQVADGYVKDIHDVLAVGDEVKVKVTKVGSDGKIGLSIRAAQEPEHQAEEQHGSKRPVVAKSQRHASAHAKAPHHAETKDERFDDMLSGFLKKSETRLSEIKKNTEGKRGGRGGRRK